MSNIARFFIRTSAFLRKEIVEILRQPRLVLTLVLGPFLILLLFGIGFRNEARPLRTLFVIDKDSGLAQQVEKYANSLGEQLIFVGVTEDLKEAVDRLARNQVDVVAVVPPDAYQTIRESQQAIITLYHYEIDPFQVDYVVIFGRVYVDEINRRILQTLAEESQTEASTVQEDVRDARASAAALRQALELGDRSEARQQRRNLARDISVTSLAVGATLGLLSSTQETLGVQDGNSTDNLLTQLENIGQNTEELDNEAEGPATEAEMERVTQIEKDLAQLETQLGEFRSIQPYVVVSPFRSEVKSIATVQPQIAHYFAPSVIVLLLQHLALTFGALSIVRDRRLGTTELFRVSPLSAIEILLGKYLSYLIFGGVLAVILTLLVVYVLQVPMLGTWLNYSLVIAALLFASLGIGFVISLLSQTDSQAVQYAMIVLLTSVFFSGFFLSLETLWRPVRVISWALPATYGILGLQNIMLRGSIPNVLLLASLAGMGLALFVVALILMRRMMARQ